MKRDGRNKSFLKRLAVVLAVCTFALMGMLGITWPQAKAHATEAGTYDWYYDANGLNAQRDYFNQKPDEVIDPFTGNVTWTFTDVYLPGKGGFDLKLNRVRTNKVLWGLDTSFPCYQPYFHMGSGWKMHMGVVWEPPLNYDDQEKGNPYIEMPDGSEHTIYEATSEYGYGYITKDFWKVEKITGGYTVRLKDGTKYYFTNYSSRDIGGASYGLYWTTKIEDPHGNTITVDYADTAPTSRINTITDSCGRVIHFYYVQKPNMDYLVDYITDGSSTLMDYDYAAGTSVDMWQGAPYVLTSANPPGSNTPPWQYHYYGWETTGKPNELQTVTYPTGATISYEYGDGTTYYYHGGDRTIRQVTARTTSEGDRWTYSYVRNSPPYDTATVNHPSGLREEYDYYGYKDASTGNVWKLGLMKEKRSYWSGSNIQTETNTWDNKTIGGERCGEFPQTAYDTYAYAPIRTNYTIERGSKSYSNGHSGFDKYGNPGTLSESGDLSRTTIYTYDYNTTKYIVDRVSREVISAGGSSRTISRTFNSNGDKTSENRYGAQTDYGYDSYGNQTSVTDDNGHTTGYSNYSYGMPETISKAGIAYIYRDINWAGTIRYESDGRSNNTDFTYDGVNRVTNIGLPGSESDISIAYGSNYRKATQGSYWFQVDLDSFGRVSGTSDAGGINTDIDYNSRDLATYRSYAYSSSNTGDSFTYDGLGRVTSVSHPGSTSIHYSYNSSSHSVTETNERNVSKTTYLQSYGNPDEARVDYVTDSAGTTGYGYDILGNITSINTPGPDHSFGYSTEGFLTSESHPETGSMTYGVDEVGNITSRTWSGQTTSYTYDSLNRLTKVYYDSEYEVNYAYDGADNRTEMKDVRGTFTYDYDYTFNSNNRLTKLQADIDGRTYTTDYGYDSRGNVTSIKYPGSGRGASFSYTSGNRVSGVSAVVGGATKTLASGVTHHPGGGVDTASLGNGISLDKDYSSRYWPTKVHYSSYSTTYLSLGLGYDNVGNITSIDDSRSGYDVTSMQYDNLDRLTRAYGNWGAGTFGYDSVGNRTSKSIGGHSTSYSYSNNRLTSASGYEPASYSYDGRGNMTGNGAHTFAYGPDNRIKTADGKFHYYYDGNGLMIMKTDDNTGKSYAYLYDKSGNVLSEIDQSASLQKDYVYLDGEPLAMIAVGPDAAAPHPSTISPNIAVNVGIKNATITGTNFQAGASVYLRMTGQANITGTVKSVTPPTTINVDLPINGVQTGQWDVVVKNTDGKEGVISKGFTVVADYPKVDAISPDGGPNTGKTTATISGFNFKTNAIVYLRMAGQSNINGTVKSLTGNTITCEFDLTGKALGAWDVVVRNPDAREGALLQGFTIVSFRVTSITPPGGTIGSIVDITNLAGSGFQLGATVKLKLGTSEINATKVVVQSGTLITCTFNLTGAQQGNYDVVVTNPGGQTATFAGGFAVSPAPPIPCGKSSGSAGIIMLGTLGLLSLAGSERRRRWLLGLFDSRWRTFLCVFLMIAVIAVMAFAPSFAPIGGVKRASTAQAQTITENVYYFHNDHLGNPMAVTDANKTVVWRTDYKPFGEEIKGTQTINNNLRFGKKVFDDDIGLVCMGKRHYDPKIGRFTSTDPMFLKDGTLQFMNMYAYAVNNPYRMIDPSGKMPTLKEVSQAAESCWQAYSKMHPVAQVAIGTAAALVGGFAVAGGAWAVAGVAAVAAGHASLTATFALVGAAMIVKSQIPTGQAANSASIATDAFMGAGYLGEAMYMAGFLGPYGEAALILGVGTFFTCRRLLQVARQGQQYADANKAATPSSEKETVTSPTARDVSGMSQATQMSVKEPPSGVTVPSHVIDLTD